jgi:hypothetical protein
LASWPSQADGATARPRDLDLACAQFVESVADVGRVQARQLQLKARLARSIQDLWHLRPQVFHLVAQTHTEAEAWRRLAVLNRHFPTRAPRSGFGALDALR